MSIRRFSTDGFSKYIPASHGISVNLGRLRPTFLKRTGDLLSEYINQKVSDRTRGPLDAIKCEKIPLANRISFKNPSTDELSSYIPAFHGFTIGLRRLKLPFLIRTGDFLSEDINKKIYPGSSNVISKTSPSFEGENREVSLVSLVAVAA